MTNRFHDPKVAQYVANEIKAMRRYHGLKQTDVANELGLSLTGYQRYEYNQCRASADILYHLAKLYKVTPGHFFPKEEP